MNPYVFELAHNEKVKIGITWLRARDIFGSNPREEWRKLCQALPSGSCKSRWRDSGTLVVLFVAGWDTDNELEERPGDVPLVVQGVQAVPDSGCKTDSRRPHRT